tara:strand:+ start:57 stop:581 length:525 start_codon:yes stop_codon:yes gene_type:complete
MSRDVYAKIPKMRLAEYLEKIENLRKFKRFSLVNQHVHDNFVYFPDVAAINVLKELLRYHNTGEMPSDYTTKGGKSVKDTKFDFTVYEHREFLMSVRGPDGSGWFTSRCPVCEHHGGDTDHNHFRFIESGAFKCFSGCESWKIIEWFNAMLNDREPKFVKGDTPNEILDYFKEE